MGHLPLDHGVEGGQHRVAIWPEHLDESTGGSFDLTLPPPGIIGPARSGPARIVHRGRPCSPPPPPVELAIDAVSVTSVRVPDP